MKIRPNIAKNYKKNVNCNQHLNCQLRLILGLVASSPGKFPGGTERREVNLRLQASGWERKFQPLVLFGISLARPYVLAVPLAADVTCTGIVWVFYAHRPHVPH